MASGQRHEPPRARVEIEESVMTGSDPLPAYRSTWFARVAFFAVTFPGIPLAREIVTDGSISWAARLAVAVPIFAVVALVNFMAWRSATIARPEHIVIRKLLRTITIPWRDVRAIRKSPLGDVTLYCHDGRRVVLPCITDGHGSTQAEKIDELCRARDRRSVET
jgi:Bacterial PH domain